MRGVPAQIVDLPFVDRSFSFRYFQVEDGRSTMKVGTDAVLLGAWVKVAGAQAILDIGTGSGVIALMMAQRSDFSAHIDAVEPDRASAMQANQNVGASPWPDKVAVHNTSIQEFHPGRLYDLIVTNPPFFRRSLLPPAPGRKVARHAETLSFDDLLGAVKRLLDVNGTFAVVLPVTEGNQFREEAGRAGFHCHRSMAFYSRPGKPQERWCLEFSFMGKRTGSHQETIVLYDEGEKWSAGYTKLTGEFYLER